jgi:hypothetical protein
MADWRVGAHAKNHNPSFLKLIVIITQSTGLLGTTGGVIFGIKIEQNVLPSERIQGNIFVILIGK